MIYGYARVSTDGQSVDAQVKQLRAAGAEKVFKETASGAKTERAELARAIRRLDDGDTLLVTRLDRLARSTRDLLNTLAQIAEKGAGFRSLGGATCEMRRFYWLDVQPDLFGGVLLMKEWGRIGPRGRMVAES